MLVQNRNSDFQGYVPNMAAVDHHVREAPVATVPAPVNEAVDG